MKTTVLTGWPRQIGTATQDPAVGVYATHTYCCPGRNMAEATPGVQTCEGCPCSLVFDNNDAVGLDSMTFRKVTAVHVCPQHH
jgi:hypothetical protein